TTPRLAQAGYLPATIRASEPFILTFNQGVNLESVKEHIKVLNADKKEAKVKLRYEKRTEEAVGPDGKKTRKEIENKAAVEILPESGDWGYDNAYFFEMEKGIAGLEGNIPSESSVKEHAFRTSSFLISKSPQFYPDADLANPLGDIILGFDQEVDMASVRENFSLEPAVDFRVNFGKKCKPDWEPEKSPDEKCPEVDDRMTIIFTPKEKLRNSKEYRALLRTGVKAETGVKYLKNEDSWKFVTADAFRILRSDPPVGGLGSYKQICLYTSTLANAVELEKKIKMVPENHGKIFADAYRHSPWTTPYYGDLYRSSNQPSPCLPKGDEKYVLRLQVLLDPDAPYSLTVSPDSADVFGQKLGAEYALKFRTEKLLGGDASLEILPQKSFATATLDQHAAPLIASQNLDSFDLQICRISAEKYVDLQTEWARAKLGYGQKYGFAAFEENLSESACDGYRKIAKKLSKAYWRKQYTEISLEKELGHAPEPGYYFIRASSPEAYTLQPRYVYDEKLKRNMIQGEEKFYHTPSQVLNLTSLHLAMKSSRDGALFWATDLKSGQPVSGVDIRIF
ncbi:hypothetical protein HYV58_00970, partial [Candidatus Peregrinibacteria bacterium]|nr:hypothetical protein [Candidatus Peregrinibacteria bacterium]